MSVVHSDVPGRARFAVRGLKRSEERRRRLQFALGARPELQRVAANAVTGTVLVHFAPDRHWRDVAPVVERTWKAVVEGRVPTPAPETQEPWFRLPVAEVLRRLGTTAEAGLSSKQVRERRARYGGNRLTGPERPPGWKLFLRQLDNVPSALLLASAGMSVVSGGMIDAALIVLVVAANAGVGFATEASAEKTLALLAELGPSKCKILRGGKRVSLAVEELIPGDILLLKSGVTLPADARLVACEGLQVDESALTGESLPVTKTAEPLPGSEPIPLAERANMVYRGTAVTAGRGSAVVVAIGAGTEIGRVHGLVSATERTETPLQRQIDDLSRRLVGITCVISAGVLAAGLARGMRLVEILKVAVSLAIAAVPEGLPTVATTALAEAATRMRRKKMLLRHLGAVETLGAVQVLCFDKTGTLTENEMTVAELTIGGRRLQPSPEGLAGQSARSWLGSRADFGTGRGAATPAYSQYVKEPQRGPGARAAARRDASEPIAPLLIDGRPVNRARFPEMDLFLKVCALCNESRREGAGYRGSATENALLDLAYRAGAPVDEWRREIPTLRIEYRNHGRNHMATSHRLPDGREWMALKGSPLEVLELCTTYERGGRTRPLTARKRQAIVEENRRLASQALRVLGLACRESNGDTPYTWLGLVGMMDPARDGMRELMAAFHRAGIRTGMLTGDQGVTARAIGERLGIAGGEPLEVVDAARLGDADWSAHVESRSPVFSRVTPADKLRIVQLVQRQSGTTAMVGDGINDAPALKAADVGIAMGKRGTDIARDVADGVLLEDDLHALLDAIAQGRATYADIRKAIHFLLSTNLCETLVVFASVAAGAGSPLSPIQLLWLNLLSDVFPALALALDPPEDDVLERPPRDPRARMVEREDYPVLLRESATMTAATLFAFAAGRRAGAPAVGNTMAFVTMTGSQLWHMLTSRSRRGACLGSTRLPRNRYIPLSLGLGFSLQALSLAVGPLRRALGLAPLSLTQLALCHGLAFAQFCVNDTLRRKLA